MTDESLIYPAVMSVESETNLLDMTELTTTFAF